MLSTFIPQLLLLCNVELEVSYKRSRIHEKEKVGIMHRSQFGGFGVAAVP